MQGLQHKKALKIAKLNETNSQNSFNPMIDDKIRDKISSFQYSFTLTPCDEQRTKMSDNQSEQRDLDMDIYRNNHVRFDENVQIIEHSVQSFTLDDKKGCKQIFKISRNMTFDSEKLPEIPQNQPERIKFSKLDYNEAKKSS